MSRSDEILKMPRRTVMDRLRHYWMPSHMPRPHFGQSGRSTVIYPSWFTHLSLNLGDMHSVPRNAERHRYYESASPLFEHRAHVKEPDCHNPVTVFALCRIRFGIVGDSLGFDFIESATVRALKAASRHRLLLL